MRTAHNCLGITWPTIKGRSEKPSRAPLTEAPSQSPTSFTFDAAINVLV